MCAIFCKNADVYLTMICIALNTLMRDGDDIQGKHNRTVNTVNSFGKFTYTFATCTKYKFKHEHMYEQCMMDEILSQILIIKSLMLTFSIYTTESRLQ